MASGPLKPGDPRRLGAYELVARLGEGGMGTVFLGRDPAGQPVAVKAIRPEYADREEFRARFRSEVNRVRQVPSFCTAAVLDADPDHRTPYLVVEYVDGPSLEEVVAERGPIPAGDLHSVAVGVAAALTAIHGAGVIHRDLKPTNVLLSLGLPKVIDFGIARALEVTSRHTRTDQVVGTMAYMAPERLDSALGPITPAADIFAWGAVVAYAGTGRIPFGGNTPMAMAARILTLPPDLDGLPEPLSELVRRALSKDPNSRPTANELVQELLVVSGPRAAVLPAGSSARRANGRFDARDLLEQFIAASPAPVSRPVEPVRVPPRRNRRSVLRSLATSSAGVTTRRLIYALGAFLLATVVAATVAYARTDGERPPADPPAAATTAPVTPLKARGPSFFDPLSAPGRIPETNDDSGSCTFAGDQLRVRTKGKATYQCPAPDDVFAGDQSITVDVNLAAAGSCAMVWFRYRGERGYQLTACADQVELEQIGGGILLPLGLSQSTALRPGARHELSIVITNERALIAIDGKSLIQAAVTDPDLTSGRVVLGVTRAGSAGAADVRFADLDVRAS